MSSVPRRCLRVALAQLYELVLTGFRSRRRLREERGDAHSLGGCVPSYCSVFQNSLSYFQRIVLGPPRTYS